MAELQTSILYLSLFISLFFEVFLLITYLEVHDELRFEKNIDKDIRNFPTVTIIVPCFNEERTLYKTVCSILKLDYPKDRLSLILIDDGSTDGTSREISKFKNHQQIRTFYKENGGKHTALNLALKHVQSDLVGCLDADSFVNSDALRKMVPFFDDEKIMAVTPSIKIFDPKNILQYVQKIEYSWGIFLRRMLSSLGALYVTPGPFSIFRTNVFVELGGYRHGHNTEDLEIALRMQKNRYKIVNSHGAHVYTVAPKRFRALYKQRVRWTYGFLNNVLDYKEMLLNRKYGNIGLFILPIAIVSIFSTIYLFSNIVWHGFSAISNLYIRLSAIGFNWTISNISFDWYFINTSIISFLTVTAVIMTLVILFLSLKLADGKFRFSRGIFYYLALYVFLVPFWLLKALYSTFFRRKVSWR